MHREHHYRKFLWEWKQTRLMWSQWQTQNQLKSSENKKLEWHLEKKSIHFTIALAEWAPFQFIVTEGMPCVMNNKQEWILFIDYNIDYWLWRLNVSRLSTYELLTSTGKNLKSRKLNFNKPLIKISIC